jgi:hypothetical protein
MAKTIQLLRKTLGAGTTYEDAVKAIQDKPLSGLSAGEPVVAFYDDGVVMGISAGSGTTSGDSAHGYVFYNAKTVDELIESAKNALIGDAIDKLDEKLTLNSLKNAIATVSAGTLTSDSDVLVISTGDTGSKISLTYDEKTIKSSGKNGVSWPDSQVTIASGTLYSTDSYIEDAFTVLGGQCGQLSAGTYISGGTTVMQLLKQMLVKLADCDVQYPTCTLANQNLSNVVEVGTSLSVNPSSTYSDGYFIYSQENYGTRSQVDAGCTQGTVTYTFTNKSQTATVSASTSFNAVEGTNTMSCESTYNASTATPKKNDGSKSTKSISAGTTQKNTQSTTGKYKYYIGCTTATTVTGLTEEHIKAATGGKSGWTETAGTTSVYSNWNSNGNSIFVATIGSLSSFNDSLSSVSLLSNFSTGTKEINIGGTSKATYNVYLWPITSGTSIKAKDIVIKR